MSWYDRFGATSGDDVPARGRITIVEQLRGLAALSVAWFHFTNGNPRFLDDGMLEASGSYGWVGVEVFFVISGFIVPFAMYRAGYDILAAPRFLVKRLLRLEPPYLVCVVLMVAFAYVSSWVPGFRGQPPSFDPAQLALHVGYLVGFTDYPWLNPVFWSLAIEFQFYLAIALLFPLVANRAAWVRLTSVLALFAISLLPAPDTLLPAYLGLFALGLVTFHFYVGWLNRGAFAALLALFAIGLSASTSLVIALPSVAAAAALAFVHRVALRPLVWLGTISYSFYLLHVPVGGRIINLADRFEPGPLGQVGAIVTALTISLAAASLYHRWLERPAQRWSARIRYGAANTTKPRAAALVLPELDPPPAKS